MQDRGSKSNKGMSNQRLSNDHEHYSELCALAATGTLTDLEWSELKAHLVQCSACGVAVQQYREIARTGMALLMPDKPADIGVRPMKSWSLESTKKEVFRRIARGDAASDSGVGVGVELSRPRTNWWRPLFSPLPQGALGYAAAIILVVAVAASAYRRGANRGLELADARVQTSTTDATLLRAQLNGLMRQRIASGDQLTLRFVELRVTREQLERQTAEVEKWRTLHAKVAEELTQQAAASAEFQIRYAALMAEREVTTRKLEDSEAALRMVQQKYESLRAQQADELHTADLKMRITELSTRLKEAEATVRQQQEFLASDRDIRELMGAREVYIADVYDVDGKGKAQKPYGRVFYTSGKSLIFYAFDLDQQRNPRGTGVFQLWGRRGAADDHPLSMGILYLDNETNKRWALKFDDPQALAQINAVFVTVEPRGGSPKPNGKQLLFASLRNVANNHP